MPSPTPIPYSPTAPLEETRDRPAVLDEPARAVQRVVVVQGRVDPQGVVEGGDEVVGMHGQGAGGDTVLVGSPVNLPARARRRRRSGRCSTTASDRGRPGPTCGGRGAELGERPNSPTAITSVVSLKRPRWSRSARGPNARSKTGARHCLIIGKLLRACPRSRRVRAAGWCRSRPGQLDLHEAASPR